MDECLNRFEEAWSGAEPPRLDDFLLPEGHAEYGPLLRELIKIDMEYRWRRPSGTTKQPHHDREPSSEPIVEDYMSRYAAAFGDRLVPIDLIAEEYRIRRRWGDNPTPSSYLDRFPNQTTAVSEVLKTVDLELSSRQSFVDRKRIQKPQDKAESSIPANRHTLVVGQAIDDFRLLNELGQGAFARVFLAQQVSMQRLVALKVSDQKSLESPVLSQLEHPNIVRVFDERQVGSMHLMYMQYVPGGSLRDIINRLASIFCGGRNGQQFLKAVSDKLRSKGETSIQEAANNPVTTLDWASTVAWLGARIADALSHSHRLGVRHRDIKPENILLTADGRPMLADFNLSFGASVQGASVEKAFGGSLAYMSPEHIQVLLGECPAELVNESSDVYSLGAVLYELLTGKRPFEQKIDLSEPNWTMTDHLIARERGPSTAVFPLSDEHALHSFIRQCLAFNVEDRPTSAHQVARQLQLLSIPRVKSLLSPTADGWAARWAKHPTAWFLLFGMLPNALFSPLNIWANHQIAIKNFDHHFFHRIEEPVVNAIAFPLGIFVAWCLATPISNALGKIRRKAPIDEPTRTQAAHQCLKLPWRTALLVLSLWAASGLVFPWWNQWASGSQVDTIDILGFFLSQVLHGLIAACLSFVLVSFIALRSFYTRLIPIDANENERQQLGKLDRQLDWANACLEMTPLFAILAIALSDQFDKLVFVALAIVGFVGHIVAASFIPRLQTTIKWLQFALLPTDELLRYREPK